MNINKLRLNTYLDKESNKKFVAQVNQASSNILPFLKRELYKGKDPSSLLTYIPKINIIDLARNPEAYIKKKARIVEQL